MTNTLSPLLDEFGVVIIDDSACELVFTMAQAGCSFAEAQAAIRQGVNE